MNKSLFTLLVISSISVVFSTEIFSADQTSAIVPVQENAVFSEFAAPKSSLASEQMLAPDVKKSQKVEPVQESVVVPKQKNAAVNDDRAVQEDVVPAAAPRQEAKKSLIDTSAEYVIDEIIEKIYTQDGSDFITRSEVERPSLEGAPRTLDDITAERLLFLDAKKYNMVPDEKAIDKHLASVQQQNNLTKEELLKVFGAAGYDYQQGRRQLGMLFAVNSIIDFKVRSRLVVPEREVTAYYNEHPVTLETAYQVQRAVVPAVSLDEAKKQLASKKAAVAWGTPVWLDESQLAESMQFVRQLPVGTTSEPRQTADGYEVFMLADKKPERLMALDERYREIADILRQPRFEKLMSEYKNKLYEEASIVNVPSANA